MLIVLFANEMAINSVIGVAFLLALLLCILQVEAEEERKLKLRKFEKIKEDADSFESAVQISEPDAEGRVTVNGTLKQKVTLNNDWKVSRLKSCSFPTSINIFLLQVNLTVYRTDDPGQEYTKHKDPPPLGVCQLMSTYYKNFFYDSLKNYSNAPDPNTCPLPPENYQMTNYPIDTSAFKKHMQPGYYRIIGELLSDGNVKLAYLSELQVE